jgi:DNA-binding ferritin-like protein (Dps family)
MAEMQVMVDEAVATVHPIDGRAPIDERTLAHIIGAVLAAFEDKMLGEQRRRDETRIDDDGRRGLAGIAE